MPRDRAESGSFPGRSTSDNSSALHGSVYQEDERRDRKSTSDGDRWLAVLDAPHERTVGRHRRATPFVREQQWFDRRAAWLRYGWSGRLEQSVEVAGGPS